MEPIDTIEYQGYTIEVVPMMGFDESPWADDEFAPSLVLHDNAERRFGWTTDHEWKTRLTGALDDIAERGVTKKLYGPGGALEIVNRWAKVAYGVKVILPISAIDHSGVAVYLGSGAHAHDPGGWDSGWIGWIILTAEKAAEWGGNDIAELTAQVRASFEDFAAWVEGDVVGYRIVDPDGDEVGSCWGFYGATKCFAEHTGYAREMAQAEIDSILARSRA
jgi:hypothetical protein